MRLLLAAVMPYLVPLAVTAILLFAGITWVKGLGYQAKAALYESQVNQLKGELALQHANNTTLRGQINSQNISIETAAIQAAIQRSAALSARDTALQALDQSMARYDQLKQDWPADCVSAVNLVRVELGL